MSNENKFPLKNNDNGGVRIFFACGAAGRKENEGDPGSPSGAFASTKKKKKDGSTPVHREMTCACDFPQIKTRVLSPIVHYGTL